ncbi:YdhK family protein [Staphylococcus chromogenes]|nr:YdhK family protein [Staphylococcus chromogenes]
MNRPVLTASALIATAALGLAGCANTQKDSATKVETATEAPAAAASHSGHSHGDHSDHAGHAGHDHAADGGAAPAGIKPAANAKFQAGQEVKLTADHMPGMKGASATIVGAFDTTTYSVTYTPTNGGAQVKDHKWVVQEELQGAGTAPLAEGTSVVLNAEHMAGMKGAKAVIDSAVTEPVYMVDVTSGEAKMKNHKWVTESEIVAK